MTTGYFPILTETNITATGSSRANAYALTKVNNEVANVTLHTGVKLPPPQPGREINIANTSDTEVLVYPSSGSESIDQLSNGVAYPLASHANIKFIGLDTARWYTMGVQGPAGTSGGPQGAGFTGASLVTLTSTISGVELHLNLHDPAGESDTDINVGNIQPQHFTGAHLETITGTVNAVHLHMNLFDPANQSNNDIDLGNIQAPYVTAASIITNTATGAELHFNLFDPATQANNDIVAGTVSGGTGWTRPWQDLAVGTMFFDQPLGKPIWWTGGSWVDATGTTV